MGEGEEEGGGEQSREEGSKGNLSGLPESFVQVTMFDCQSVNSTCV